MKRVAVLLLLFVSAGAFAQQITIKESQSIAPEQGQYAHPVLDASGRYVAFTTPGYKGLWIYNTKSGTQKKITEEAGAGYMPVFDPNANIIYYRENQYRGFKKYSSLHAYSIDNTKNRVMKEASRFVSPPVLSNGRIVFQQEDKLSHILIDEKKAKKHKLVDVRNENKGIRLTIGEETKFLAPNGEGHYLWVSLSPDQEKILFTMAGKGTYVCDKAGNILKEIGYLNAPEWLTNDFVIGMRDEDDGHRIIASDIFIVGVNSTFEKNLTSTEDAIEMHPSANREGSKVTFHTMDGTIEILDIRIER